MGRWGSSSAWGRQLAVALLVGGMVLASPAAALADKDHQQQSTNRGGDDDSGSTKLQTARQNDDRKDDDKQGKGDGKAAVRASTPAPAPKPPSNLNSRASLSTSQSRTSTNTGTSASRQADGGDETDADDDGPKRPSFPSRPKVVFVPPPTVVTAPTAPMPRPAVPASSPAAPAASASAALSASASSSSSNHVSPAGESSNDSADPAVSSGGDTASATGDAASAAVQADTPQVAVDPSLSDSANLALLDVSLPPIIGDIFADLGSALGSWLGQPVAPVQVGGEGCEIQQPTTLGLAFWNCASQVSTFLSADGRHRWAMLDGRLVQWLGPRAADPIDLSGTLAPGPWNLVCIGANGDQQDACVIGAGTVTGGVIDQPGADRVYVFQVEGSPARAHVELADLPADYDLYLVDGTSAVVGGSAHEGTLAESVDVVLQPGPYLLYVHSDPGRAVDPSLPFRLSLNLSPPAA